MYVEKPPTWCIWEGRKMVEAARKYGRMVQIGTQNRSSPNVREGMQKLKEGVIGKLYMARGMTYKMRGNLGKHNPQPVPAGLNWDAWVGPAKMVEYSSFQHRRWYWTRNFASGDVANQTVHDIDKIRWGLGLDEHPITVMSMGDRFAPGEDDDADTPNTQAFLCKWADHKVLVTFEFRHWYTNTEAEMRDKYPFVAENQCVGEIFFGTKGYMIFPDYCSYYTFLGPKNEPGPFKTDGQGSDAKAAGQLIDWTPRAPRTSATGSRRSAAASTRISTPTSSRATSRRPSATWPRSPASSAAASISIRRPNASSTTPRPTSSSSANTARRTSCRRRCDVNALRSTTPSGDRSLDKHPLTTAAGPRFARGLAGTSFTGRLPPHSSVGQRTH